MVPRLLLDLDPLRESRDFRLLFAGLMASMFGSQLTRVAIPFEVYALTRSSLQVGLVSLAQLVPLVLGALVGGTLGDGLDRRTLLVTSLALTAATSAALAVNASLSHPSLAIIYVVSALAAGLGGVASTAGASMVPGLVEPRHLLAAYTTLQVVDQVGMVLGPALAGLLIEGIGLPWVFSIDAVTYLLMTVTVLCMATLPPLVGTRRPGLASIREGLGYVRGRQVLEGVYLVDSNAMVFGMPRALFPALATTVFHGGAGTLGLLYAAPGAGALLGALGAGWLGRIRAQGRSVIVAVCVWGAAIVAFGTVDGLWVALALLALAGWADVISAVLRTTILQRSVPEALRGRISSIQTAVVEGGPRLGDVESGAVAGAVSTGFAVVSGGVACIAGALVLAHLLPEFRRYRRPSASGGTGDPTDTPPV